MTTLYDTCRATQAEVDAAHQKFLNALDDAGMIDQAVNAILAVMECTPSEAADILQRFREGRIL